MSPIAIDTPPQAPETAPKPTVSAPTADPGWETSELKPVADNFMYDFKHNGPLPTLDRLGADIPAHTAATVEAQKVLDELTTAFNAADAEAFAAVFLEDGIWRDKTAITWEYRTFNGASRIREAANVLLPRSPISDVKLLDPKPLVSRPYPDLAHIQFHFAFKTSKVGASGVANIVPTPNGYKIWTLHTAIESLIGSPELPNRDGHTTGPVSWVHQRELDTHFDHAQPEIVIIGGGHNGLMTAARFKALGVPALVIERNQRVGDNWRKRYEALSLHFPHWADHFPYMPYPDHWPVYCPAQKLGDWLEWYTSALEPFVWTDSSVVSCQQLADNSWSIEISRGGHGKRVLTPKHLIMATSLAGVPYSPTIPDRDVFKGTVRHSTQHDSSREWVGNKVLVVGTSSSGFDTAFDFARRRIDVTLLQRSRTYIMSLTASVPRILGIYEPINGVRPDLDAVDRIAYSMPVGPSEELARRLFGDIAEDDKRLIAAIEGAGFKTWMGQRGTGNATLSFTKNGGFYFDAGACEHVINGNIKVEQGYIEKFTQDKVSLNGGREKDYDLVVLATGFSNTLDSVRATLGEAVADPCGPIWGMDEEGELNAAWKTTGVPNFWIMVGTLQHGRYHGRKLALRIKAMLEGIDEQPYRD